MSKRFKADEYYEVFDNDEFLLSFDQVVDLLNELNDENEELKSKLGYEKRQHKHWKKEWLENIKEIAQLKREIVQLKEEIGDVYIQAEAICNKLNELYEENQRLKQYTKQVLQNHLDGWKGVYNPINENEVIEINIVKSIAEDLGVDLK